MKPKFDFASLCDEFKAPAQAMCAGEYMMAPDKVRKAVTELRNKNYFIEDVTGLDVSEGIEVLYHFDHFEAPGRIILRTIVPHDAAELPTISDIFQGADWHERETMDMYPVSFTNHPNPLPLLLPDGLEERPLAKTEKARKPAMELRGVKAEEKS